MSFIVLGSIGSIVGTVGSGIGAVGAGIASLGAGTALGGVTGAVGSAVGGLGGLLTGAGGALGGAAGAGGAAIGTGEAVGAASSAISSLGPAAGAATPEAVPAAVPGAVPGAVPEVASTGAPGAVATGAPEAAPGIMGKIGGAVLDALPSEASSFITDTLGLAPSEVGHGATMLTTEGAKGAYDTASLASTNATSRDMTHRMATRGNWATGGLATLKGGGSIKMVDGQYVIPADVVSALGNGSSKAGAKYLAHAFERVRTQGPSMPHKPKKQAGELAMKRMIERTKRA